MFKPASNAKSFAFENVEHTYRIQQNDRLSISLYINGGEDIIQINPSTTISTSAKPVSESNENQGVSYLVDSLGSIELPVIGRINLLGLSLNEANKKLTIAFEPFFKNPFVKVSFINKRVILLGAFGSKVIPLTNENIRLTEVLALADTDQPMGKFHNIRILRDGKYFISDLSTLENFNQNNIIIQANDVIYVEPAYKPVREAIRDYSSLISILATLTTVIVVIQSN